MAYKYYFNLKTLYIQPGKKTVLMNKYEYRLSQPARAYRDCVYITLNDVRRIFAHVLKIDEDFGKVTVDMPGTEYGEIIVYSELMEGISCIAIDTVMEHFGWRRIDMTTREANDIVMLTSEAELTAIPMPIHKYIDNINRGKKYGDRHDSFWFEEGGKLIPYRIYRPTNYDGRTKLPVIFYLHGGMGTPDSGFDHSNGDLAYYAEKYNYVVVGSDGFIENASYGYSVSPNPGDLAVDYSCPENPMHHDEEALKGFKLGEHALEALIKEICANYAVDPGNMFLMGNSMGGVGTLSFAINHPGMFRAINPAGAMINTRIVDFSSLKGLPVLVIAGTEDHHGFDYIRSGAEEMKREGMDISWIWVGGGTHGGAWGREVENIYKFFEEHRA